MGDTYRESDFEDRFLQCFGLGDPELGQSSQSGEGEREEQLRVQSENSPW